MQVCLTAVGAQVQKSISHLECPKVRVFFQVCLCRGGSHFSGATLKVQGQAGCVELNKRVCLWGCCRRGYCRQGCYSSSHTPVLSRSGCPHIVSCRSLLGLEIMGTSPRKSSSISHKNAKRIKEMTFPRFPWHHKSAVYITRDEVMYICISVCPDHSFCQ